MRGAQRPAVELSVQTHFEILRGIAVMEGDPAAALLEAHPTNQEMGLRSMRLNDVRAAARDDFSEHRLDRGIEAAALGDHVQLNSSGAHRIQERIRFRT